MFTEKKKWETTIFTNIPNQDNWAQIQTMIFHGKIGQLPMETKKKKRKTLSGDSKRRQGREKDDVIAAPPPFYSNLVSPEKL